MIVGARLLERVVRAFVAAVVAGDFEGAERLLDLAFAIELEMASDGT